MFVRDLLKKTNKLITWESSFSKVYESQMLLSNLLNKNFIEIILRKDLMISEKKKKSFLNKFFLET